MKNEDKIVKIKDVIKSFNNLDLEERQSLMLKIPIKIRIELYSKIATLEQLKLLCDEWNLKEEFENIDLLIKKLLKERRNLDLINLKLYLIDKKL